MTASTEDDAFREIQLSGKQLLFLFMAATVASVVIFLCGVLVGRGVRSERAAAAEADLLNTSPQADRSPASLQEPSTTISDAPIVPPPPAGDEVAEIRAGAPAPAAAGKAPNTKAPVDAPKPAAGLVHDVEPAKSAKATKTAPILVADSVTGGTWAVQVAALASRNDANAFLARLATHGITGYVENPPSEPAIYRVRVAGFSSRREADAMMERLRRELHLTPFITQR